MMHYKAPARCATCNEAWPCTEALEAQVKVRCKARTEKGTQCRFSALTDGLCPGHLRKRNTGQVIPT